ncbi:hypothetical protein CHY_2379 [Carboxydothermus hydrogenoformans Z-2901]|uniref:Uncharacterized protein n=1 Tax=Carboxydothermus hydrogenoformans (strain ATCC BAA-161 / DSM 6008 / Z-2901) TaxID=246194 RepID=Q3A9K8_CARHZ|nr:hypothetical protein CHY_2379 [Carboxydothermus hydrogenoformans Z-2901]
MIKKAFRTEGLCFNSRLGPLDPSGHIDFLKNKSTL